MKTPNASAQAIELNQRCSGQVHFKGPRIGPGDENEENGCTFEILVLRAPFIICPLMPSLDRPKNSFHRASTNGRLDFSLSGGKTIDPAS